MYKAKYIYIKQYRKATYLYQTYYLYIFYIYIVTHVHTIQYILYFNIAECLNRKSTKQRLRHLICKEV